MVADWADEMAQFRAGSHIAGSQSVRRVDGSVM